MKKVVNITIGGVVFTIEEDAYTTLSEYLRSIREHFKHADEQGEIVDDIELGIAEKFSQRKTSVIREHDVKAIIKEMGTTADFAELDVDADSTETFEGEKIKKKLYRNVDDQIIAGVASGIAAYFGVDPVFIRLLFVLSIFLNGFGILVYLVLWVVMPPAETVSQKLEMQGDPVTLHQFEKMIKDKIPSDAREKTSTLTRFLEVPFAFLKAIVQFFSTLVRNIGPALKTVLGVLIIVGSIGGAVALSIALTGVHFSINSGLFELPVREFLSGSQYFTGLISLYALFIIPAALMALLGAALLRKVSKFSGLLIAGLLVAWAIALFNTGHTASQLVPQYTEHFKNMEEVTQLHELDAFTDISIYSSDDVLIKNGDTYSVEITGKEVSVKRRTLEVHNGVLTINDEKNKICIGCFNPSVNIVITTPTVESISASHSAEIVTEQFETESLYIDLSHSAVLELDIIADKVIAEIAHSSELILTGVVDQLTADAWYSSHVDTSGLVNDRAAFELRYSSSADIGETKVLNVTTRYSSDARYDGDPELTEDTSDSSSLKKKF